MSNQLGVIHMCSFVDFFFKKDLSPILIFYIFLHNPFEKFVFLKNINKKYFTCKMFFHK